MHLVDIPLADVGRHHRVDLGLLAHTNEVYLDGKWAGHQLGAIREFYADGAEAIVVELRDDNNQLTGWVKAEIGPFKSTQGELIHHLVGNV